MKKFRLINNISGWTVFAVAMLTYLLTVEPTASFWDCGEFITTSYKLEVGHPPGAPFFMLLGRFFSLFAFGDVTKVALMVNILSVTASAFTILFLFWTITHIARRIFVRNGEVSINQLVTIIGSGIVGALVYTFSDSFWFSAVEGEVYATSSFFTAIVFWAILKWEDEADQAYSNRWLILIAYLMGLSIGVHLLNLLAIPAIVFVFYFKKYETSAKGIVWASVLSVALLGFVMYGIIQGVVLFGSKFELFFTNSLGLPYFVGFFIFLLIAGGLLAFGIFYTLKKQMPILNTIFGGMLVILIGYSSFALIPIRSIADTPMNQNRPDDVFSLLAYLNREQYGDRPLMTGQYFNAPIESYDEGAPEYTQRNDRYEVADYKIDRKFDEAYTTFFPRMYSDQEGPDHVEGYMAWTGTSEDDFYYPKKDESGKAMKDRYGNTIYDRGPFFADGETQPKRPPTFGENLRFFFSYQVNYMYVRYFMWNFVGRQNDIQGNGGIRDGNWISGIKFIDEIRLGDQDKLPTELKENKGRNTYFFLPLLLGILGMVFMLTRDKLALNYFWIVMLFFFFTGLAIVFYLNQPPFQPRERDYAYAGSFYVFAIYVGFGVAGLAELLKKLPKNSGAIAATIIGLTAPVIMASQNWDDHDRSNRYTASDYAKNYLNSCAPNAVIFTNGDNDTFPLWYIQEVEGYRTDVRVINLSYFNTDWYINQMRIRAYESAPIDFILKPEQYDVGKRDIIYRYENPNIYLKERFEASGGTLKADYDSLYSAYIKFLNSSNFPEKYPKETETLAQGTSKIGPADMYGLSVKLADVKFVEKEGLNYNSDVAKKFSTSFETLVRNISDLPLSLNTLMAHIASEDEDNKVPLQDGTTVNYMPTTKLMIPVNKADVIKNNVVSKADESKIVSRITWNLSVSNIRKNHLMVLDLIASNGWKRPVYFATTVPNSNFLNLEPYFQLEGLAYRLVPIKSSASAYGEDGRVNSDILYDNVMNKFVWGGIDKNPEKIYMDENNRRFLMNFKSVFKRLAQQLADEKQNEKAEQVLDKAMLLFNNDLATWGYYDLQLGEIYYAIEKPEKGNAVIQITYDNLHEELVYYFSLNDRQLTGLGQDVGRNIALIQEVVNTLDRGKQTELKQKILTELMEQVRMQKIIQDAESLTSNEEMFYRWIATLPEAQRQFVGLYLFLMDETGMTEAK